MLLDEKIIAIENALADAGIPHAFGGANALAYYATPRATADIDLNVFVPESDAGRVLAVLGALGAATSASHLLKSVAERGQVRVPWDGTPIDVFFSYDALHESSMERRRSVDFGDVEIHILSAEDLVIYKVVFDREKDWRDIAEMVFANDQPLDFDYVRRWLRRILEQDDARLARIESVVDSGGRDLG